ncbi:hypothetical protein ACFWHR_07390 [Leucobacter sp. NPDC058333]|uniref:hypothetical protein n=1 Tax=Leucobacter sp. NPDC058333 TaxID=3346450 RepID=UPI00364F8C38
MIINVHERGLRGSSHDVAELLMTLAGSDDRIWPGEAWPKMQFADGLVVGANGGHGPVRYRIELIDPAGRVAFQFTRPTGFGGGHAFSVVDTAKSGETASVVLRHELQMFVTGMARVSWPLFFRPQHDALIEEALDKAEPELGTPPLTPYRRSLWTRVLRRAAFSRVVVRLSLWLSRARATK